MSSNTIKSPVCKTIYILIRATDKGLVLNASRPSKSWNEVANVTKVLVCFCNVPGAPSWGPLKQVLYSLYKTQAEGVVTPTTAAADPV